MDEVFEMTEAGATGDKRGDKGSDRFPRQRSRGRTWTVRAGVLLIIVAVIASAAGAALASAPLAAPRVMTMGTMSWMMGVTGYHDEGHCRFSMVDMDNPTETIEREFSCGFAWDWSEYEDGEALVHEVLYDFETGGVFTVPGMEGGQMQEWYRVNAHMLTPDALQFLGPVRGQAGVLMPPPGSNDVLTMGWVESNGQKGAQERLVTPRALNVVGETEAYGIKWQEWASSLDRVRTSWHGYDLYLSEDVFMRSDPQTAWILQMDRHVVVEMTPYQMAEAFGMGVDESFLGLPVEIPLDKGSLGEPEWVMELHYRTLDEKRSDHAEQTQEFQELLALIDNSGKLGPWVLLGSLAGLLAGIALVAVGRREPPASSGAPPKGDRTGARPAGGRGAGIPGAVQGIDPRSPRFSQGVTGAALILAFLLAGIWTPVVFTVPVLAVVLGAGALFGPRFNVLGLAFTKLAVPLFGLGRPKKRKDPAPTRFALLLGTVFLLAASVLLLATTGTAYWTGWGLALAVAALALLAAVTDLCVGCEIYNFVLRLRNRSSRAAEATESTQSPDAG